MIEIGGDIMSQLRIGATTTDLAMAQIFQYNGFAIPKTEKNPFTVCRGMSVYAETNKRQLIQNAPSPWSQYSI